mgnify:CR=1 FL=1
MRLFHICLLFVCLLPASISAQSTKAIKGETAYSFWLHTPDESASTAEKQPVFVFLHGRSLCGNNLDRVKRYGLIYAMDKGTEVPGIVIAPQAQSKWNADKVMEVVDYVLKSHPEADPARVYVCGMSLGGYGTMEVAGKYPDRIAAAVAICGGGNTADASDRIVPISESKKIMNAIKKADPDAEVSLNAIKGGTHGSVEKLFHKSDIYDWMLKHRKEKALAAIAMR